MGGMKSSKINKGRNASKKVGNHWCTPTHQPSLIPIRTR